MLLQVLPELQLMHWPEPLQTWPAPQLVPPIALVASTQTVLPNMQAVRPVTQGAPGFEVHTWLGTQVPQVPLLSHIWLEPHGVPGALLLPSTQRRVPVLHSVMPLRHAEEGLVVQATLAVHELHEPAALQT